MLLRRVVRDATSLLLFSHKTMILMPQIFDVIANEIARYKRNELESKFTENCFDSIMTWASGQLAQINNNSF